jgi:hypothetical protein
MPKNSSKKAATRRTSLLFAVMGLVLIAALSFVAVQSGAIDQLNQSEFLHR